MSSSPHNQPSESGSSEQNLQFKAENIGHWTKQQEDPFAAQNRKKEAKKQKSAATRKKAMPYIIIAAAVIVVGLIVWGVIALVNHLISINSISPIAGGSLDDITNYNEALQNYYTENDNDLEKVKQRADEALQVSMEQGRGDAALLAVCAFYARIEEYDLAIEKCKQTNLDTLDWDQQALYYALLGISYEYSGDPYNATIYNNYLYEMTSGTTTGEVYEPNE